MQNQYKVINASAGSGKTYRLVQSLLEICLKHPNKHEKIRNILALTFTNKAANEMKQRIIKWLKTFVQDDFELNAELKGIQEKLKEQGINVTMQELHNRSKKLLDYILHHYSTLNIGTIDKFNSKLVRSFSQELGLAQNFNMEINAEPFLIEAVDKMLEEIGDQNKVSEAFMDFVNYNLDNEDRVNLSSVLYSSAKEYVQDKHFYRLNANKDFDWNAYEVLKNSLRKEIKELEENSISIAENVLDLLREKNLQPDDFASAKGGTIGAFFLKVLEKIFPIPEDEFAVMEKFLKGSSSKSKNRQGEILEILDYLLENRKKIINNFVLAKKKEKILEALLPLKVNKEIQDKLAEIEEENDLVLLSKFNVMIHENLREEPSAFIYEKVGTKFSHFFFDEFQDTSFIQWQNFLPLRDHSISQENMSFTVVGDPKQSIYSFRGGDAQLMLDIINKKENVQTFAQVENLKNNWRSAKNIVQFNNKLYQFMADFTNDEHQAIFGEGSWQAAKSNFEGRVRINLIENAVKAVYFEEVAAKMREDIQDCLDHGYQFSDITILCRGNKEIFKFSQVLGNLKVNKNGQEVYIKTISDSGLTLNLSSTILALTEFLRWQQNPKNNQFPVKMLYYLKELGRISIDDFTAEMLEMLVQQNKSDIEKFIQTKYNLDLNRNDLLELNLYHFIEHFLKLFSVEDKETDFLFNYLEMVYNYSQNAGSTLKDFLKYWDEEAHKTTVQVSENIDAVQIMTIHKAKGLEFPVVFLPMSNDKKPDKNSNWLDVDSLEKLNAVNVQAFSTNLEIYDEQIATFNQENSYRQLIDRFCVQYVATTRPVEQLFFYLEKPNKSSNHLEIYDFIEPKIPMNNAGEKLSSFDLYEVSDAVLQKQKVEKKPKFKTVSVNFGAGDESNLDAIKISTPSKNYQNRVETVRIGIFTHEVLAKINSEKDVEKVLSEYLMNGIITEEEKITIAERILALINNDQYAKYFQENQVVINEKDIMISENGDSKIYRPDRLIDTGNGFIILDFKTGGVKEKHQKQLDQYKSVLEKIGKTVLETEIIYV